MVEGAYLSEFNPLSPFVVDILQLSNVAEKADRYVETKTSPRRLDHHEPGVIEINNDPYLIRKGSCQS
jgi:hypothetical protein